MNRQFIASRKINAQAGQVLRCQCYTKYDRSLHRLLRHLLWKDGKGRCVYNSSGDSPNYVARTHTILQVYKPEKKTMYKYGKY